MGSGLDIFLTSEREAEAVWSGVVWRNRWCSGKVFFLPSYNTSRAILGGRSSSRACFKLLAFSREQNPGRSRTLSQQDVVGFSFQDLHSRNKDSKEEDKTRFKAAIT